MYLISNPDLIETDAIAAVISNSGWRDAVEVAGVSFGAVFAILAILFLIMSVVSVVLRKLRVGQDSEEKQE